MSDFKAKMHQFNFHWGSAPEPAGGAYSAPLDPVIVLLRGRRRERGNGWEEREREVEFHLGLEKARFFRKSF